MPTSGPFTLTSSLVGRSPEAVTCARHLPAVLCGARSLGPTGAARSRRPTGPAQVSSISPRPLILRSTPAYWPSIPGGRSERSAHNASHQTRYRRCKARHAARVHTRIGVGQAGAPRKTGPRRPANAGERSSRALKAERATIACPRLSLEHARRMQMEEALIHERGAVCVMTPWRQI